MSDRKPCVVGKCKKGTKYGNIPLILLLVGIGLSIFGFILGFAYSLIFIIGSLLILIPTDVGVFGFILGAVGVVLLIVGIILFVGNKPRE